MARAVLTVEAPEIRLIAAQVWLLLDLLSWVMRDNQGNAKTERVKECNLWKHDRFYSGLTIGREKLEECGLSLC